MIESQIVSARERFAFIKISCCDADVARANLSDKNIITPDIELEQWARKQFQIPRKLGDRPAISDADIKEIFNLSKKLDGDSSNGSSTDGFNGGTSTTSTRRDRGGNMGKGNDVN